MERARQLTFHCAVSNPCFEYWLLLHFEPSARPYPDCGAVVRHLRRHVDGYAKGTRCFDSLEEGIGEAINRAEHNDRTRCAVSNLDPVDCHPCTHVYRLVRRLLVDGPPPQPDQPR